MKKDLFFIANLCVITRTKETVDKKGQKSTMFVYDNIKNGIFYFKNGKYFDIDTDIGYSTSYNKEGDFFIQIGSIVPFSAFLKKNNLDCNNLNKVKVRQLYDEYKEKKKK